MVLLSSAITASCDKPFGEWDLKLGKKGGARPPRPPLSNHDPATQPFAGTICVTRNVKRRSGPKPTFFRPVPYATPVPPAAPPALPISAPLPPPASAPINAPAPAPPPLISRLRFSCEA